MTIADDDIMTDRPEKRSGLIPTAGLMHPSFCMGGFTFIEILLSLMLLSILTAIFGMGLVAAMESYAFSRANADTAQKGQLAMQRISRELSELVAIRTISSAPAYIIYSRVQNNDNAPPSMISMGIYHSGSGTDLYLFSDIGDLSELSITGDHAGKILLDNVHDFSMSFFSGNEDWIFGSDPPNQLSTIQIAINLNRGDATDLKQSFTGLVHTRNINISGGAHLYE